MLGANGTNAMRTLIHNRSSAHLTKLGGRGTPQLAECQVTGDPKKLWKINHDTPQNVLKMSDLYAKMFTSC